MPTLEVLAAQGIKFTVLAPQPGQPRPEDGRAQLEGHSATAASIPPWSTGCACPRARPSISSSTTARSPRAVAFEGLLDNGEQFAERLLGAFSEETRPWPELVHIATDGETYGHHHQYGEMALAYALNYIESNDLAELTNYGLYLERHPPTHEVEIFENSSWSCVHGVERWRSNCGCNSGGHAGWNQEWRARLRAALDWLRDTLAPLFEEKAKTVAEGPVGGAQRLHRCGPGSLAGQPRQAFSPSTPLAS